MYVFQENLVFDFKCPFYLISLFPPSEAGGQEVGGSVRRARAEAAAGLLAPLLRPRRGIPQLQLIRVQKRGQQSQAQQKKIHSTTDVGNTVTTSDLERTPMTYHQEPRDPS